MQALKVIEVNATAYNIANIHLQTTFFCIRVYHQFQYSQYSHLDSFGKTNVRQVNKNQQQRHVC